MGEYCTIQGKKKHLVCSRKLNDLLVRNDVHEVDPLLALGRVYSRDSCSGPMGCRESKFQCIMAQSHCRVRSSSYFQWWVRQNSHKLNTDYKQPFRNLFIVKQFFPFSTRRNVGRIGSISAISLVRSLILSWTAAESSLEGEQYGQCLAVQRAAVQPCSRAAVQRSEGFATPFFPTARRSPKNVRVGGYSIEELHADIWTKSILRSFIGLLLALT